MGISSAVGHAVTFFIIITIIRIDIITIMPIMYAYNLRKIAGSSAEPMQNRLRPEVVPRIMRLYMTSMLKLQVNKYDNMMY